jgi:hypothetical protein
MGGYQRVIVHAGRAADTRGVFEMLPGLLLLAAGIDAAVLYGIEISRRVHRRRIDERLQQVERLYGAVRITLAQRRTA